MRDQHKNTLKEVTQHVRASSYLDYASFLEDCFQWIKLRSANYSYIAFADDLGFSKTNVIHLMIRGKRRLSPKGADRIIQALQIKNTDRLYFETLVRYQNARLTADRETLFSRLMELKSKSLSSPIEQSQLEYYSEWFHPVIREMVGMFGFKPDPQWIVKHIEPRVLPEQARKSLALLEELNLIEHVPETGKYKLKSQHVTTGDEIASHAVVRYHQRTIEIGRESVMNFDHNERNISSVTMSISAETFDKIAVEIAAFRKKILDISESSTSPDRVYQLNIQLFPFTKPIKEDPK
ncbi:TIGR02147 family protein [bacterium]|nr:TIGR02147 family protein [bacterium]